MNRRLRAFDETSVGFTIRFIIAHPRSPSTLTFGEAGVSATLAERAAERGLAGHLIAATLGHEDQRTTMHVYAAPGSESTGVNRRGLLVLNGGVQVPAKSAK